MAIFAASAVYAGVVAVFSGIGVHRQWAIMAAPAYLLAAVAAGWKRRGLDVSLLLGFAGGLIVPLTWMAAHGESQREIKVIIRSAWSLIHHGTPYHSTAVLAGTQNPDVFNPYLPVMALYGMARTVLGGGILTDPRLWLGATFVGAFALALSSAGATDIWRWTGLVTATPLVAFPLAVGGDDLPVLGLMCLGLALLWRPGRQPGLVLAGLTLGVAAAMKATAWPVLIVAVVWLAARDGMRAAARFAFTALAVFADPGRSRARRGAGRAGGEHHLVPAGTHPREVRRGQSAAGVPAGADRARGAPDRRWPARFQRPGPGSVPDHPAAQDLPFRHLVAHHRHGRDVHPGAGQPVRLLHLPGRPVGLAAGVESGGE